MSSVTQGKGTIQQCNSLPSNAIHINYNYPTISSPTFLLIQELTPISIAMVRCSVFNNDFFFHIVLAISYGSKHYLPRRDANGLSLNSNIFNSRYMVVIFAAVMQNTSISSWVFPCLGGEIKSFTSFLFVLGLPLYFSRCGFRVMA